MKSYLKTALLTTALMAVAGASFASVPAKPGAERGALQACAKAADSKKTDAEWTAGLTNCLKGHGFTASISGKSAPDAAKRSAFGECLKSSDPKMKAGEWVSAFDSCLGGKDVSINLAPRAAAKAPAPAHKAN